MVVSAMSTTVSLLPQRRQKFESSGLLHATCRAIGHNCHFRLIGSDLSVLGRVAES